MKKITIASLLMLICVFLLSCNMEKLSVADYLAQEIQAESASFELPKAGFEINKSQLNADAVYGQYTAGVMEYTSEGQIMASVHFGEGMAKDQAKGNKDGEEFVIDLVKEGIGNDPCEEENEWKDENND